MSTFLHAGTDLKHLLQEETPGSFFIKDLYASLQMVCMHMLKNANIHTDLLYTYIFFVSMLKAEHFYMYVALANRLKCTLIRIYESVIIGWQSYCNCRKATNYKYVNFLGVR